MSPEKLNPNKLPVTEIQKKNLEKLAQAVSKIEEEMGKEFLVTSGLRSKEMQLKINPAAKNSAHISGEAVDVSDVDGDIYAFCIDHVPLLIELGIYLECKTYTKRWAHMQIRAPKSGNRFFIP